MTNQYYFKERTSNGALLLTVSDGDPKQVPTQSGAETNANGTRTVYEKASPEVEKRWRDIIGNAVATIALGRKGKKVFILPDTYAN